MAIFDKNNLFTIAVNLRRTKPNRMKAFLLAAGLGTRLKPFTDKHPKALATVNGKSLLEINIRNLQRFGIYHVVVNVHHFAQQIIQDIDANDGYGSSVEISDESEAVLETGGGLLYAKKFFEQEDDFLVMNVDVLSNIDIKALIRQHTLTQPMATLAVMKRNSTRAFLFDGDMQLCGWKNLQTGEEKIPDKRQEKILQPFAFSGIQMMNSNIFDHIHFTGKFSLVDLYLDLCNHQKIIGWEHTGDMMLDVGKPESLEKAAQLFQ